jgi:hypothetical protein
MKSGRVQYHQRYLNTVSTHCHITCFRQPFASSRSTLIEVIDIRIFSNQHTRILHSILSSDLAFKSFSLVLGMGSSEPMADQLPTVQATKIALVDRKHVVDLTWVRISRLHFQKSSIHW